MQLLRENVLHDINADKQFAYECHIRDFFAKNITQFRPGELVSSKEVIYAKSNIRADLRTVNCRDVIFEWEFKIEADYSAIGQVLSYTAQAKTEFGFKRTVRPVIAAFKFPDEIKLAIEVNNLGIETVELPLWLRAAGSTPNVVNEAPKIFLPTLNKHTFKGY